MIIRKIIVFAKNIIIDIASKYKQVNMKREKVGEDENFRSSY